MAILPFAPDTGAPAACVITPETTFGVWIYIKMGSLYTSMAPDPYDKGPDTQMSKGKLAVLATATALIA